MAIIRRVRKCDGIVTFLIRYQLPNGKRVKEKAGGTKGAAQRLLSKRLGEIDEARTRGELDFDPRRKPGRVSFGFILDKFQRDYASSRRSPYYAQTCKLLRMYFGEDTAAESITEADIERFGRDRRLGTIDGYRPAGNSTIRKNLTIAGIFESAIDLTS